MEEHLEQPDRYLKPDVPPHLAAQVMAFVRQQWPTVITAEMGWDETPYPVDGTHFILSDGDALVSHALAHTRWIEHRDTRYRVAGLSSVFTCARSRGRGCGGRVVAAATEHIRQNAADVAMLFCDPRLRNFYAAVGWEPMEGARILFGDHLKPQRKTDNLVMMLFFSPAGRAARETFRREPLYVGPTTW